ncbi:BRO family protein [Azospirillum sp. B2RO_4]|uniref:BRO family protein n=1 Tax=Azospirillum sp. B2RO_4 TaxID=3027796 RepID=UPI003DA99021
MKSLTPLNFEDHAMRVVSISGELWFVLVDVCVALDISNPATAAGRLNADERNSASIQTAGGPQDMTIINEMGLWSLVMTSRKPSAQRFKAWLASVAIPSLHAGRQDGQVPAPQNLPANAATSLPMAVFAFEGLDVRVTDQSGDPWFVLADVCRVLEYTDSAQAARNLEDDEIHTLHNMQGITGSRNGIVKLVNESGLYSLILTSRKPAAKRFKKWVTAEVLPSIRKTGGYGTPAQKLDLNDPAQLRALLLTYSTEVETTKKALAVAKEEASVASGALDRIAGADGSLTATQAAKDLQVPRHVLLTYMRTNRWVYRPRGCADDLPYQDRIESGYLTLKVEVLPRDDGTEKVIQRARITPKGLTKLAQVVPGARRIGGKDAH